MGTETAWWREPTRGQWFTFLAAWVGWVLDAFDFTIFLLVMPALSREFHVGVTATAGSITLTLLLRLFGGVAAGAAADRWGRKLPLMISLLWFAACDGAVAFAPSFKWVLVLRTLFGFGMGAEWTAGATLAMENWPARSRGIASGVLQGSWAVGYLLAALAFGYLVPHWGWRALFLVAAAPALLVLPIRMFVPESEEWKGRKRDARASISRGEYVAPAQLRGHVRTIAWASVVMGCGFGAYYGLTGLYPTLLDGLGFKPASIAHYVMLFNLGMMGGAIITGVLAAKKGVARAVAVPALASLPFLPLYVGSVPALIGVGAFFGGGLAVGFTGVTPLFLTGLFPPEVRARAVGVVYHVGALFAAFVPTVMAFLVQRAHVPLPRAILVVAVACELGLVALFSAAATRRRSAALPGSTDRSEPVASASAH
ncbi:MAG: major facilitator superfamily 1 [bacterium]|nr:major facilitator superfamily 1 [bacterium]